MSILQDIGTKIGTELKNKLGINDTAADSTLFSGLALDKFMNAKNNNLTDANVLIPGSYRIDSLAANSPDSSRYFAMVVYGNSSNVTSQIATDYVTSKMYTRSYNASWGNWVEVGIDGTSTQYHIMGTLTNTAGGGIANAFTIQSSVNLSWSSDRIVVPKSGIYSISFNTISDSSSVRVDADIYVNGTVIINLLSEIATGYHQKTATISKYLSAGDYIQFSNDNWYSPTTTNTTWKTASVTYIG